MDTFDITDHSHRRYNPLIDEWILVSPHRAKRPWKGDEEEPSTTNAPEYDPTCTLCPSNTRISGEKNPDYTTTFVFTNDFEAIPPNTPEAFSQTSLLQYQSVQGTCKVMCYSPKHNVALGSMTVDEIVSVITNWKSQMQELGERYQWVQVFENKGKAMGASNPHPHGQIWASNFLPTQINKEHRQQLHYFEAHHTSLLLDYLQEELHRQERILWENDSWVILVPYWAVWPFETMLLPKKHTEQLLTLSENETSDLAQSLKILVSTYDNLFQTSFPFSMGWHQAPFSLNSSSHWQLHAHFYPPLLRSATVRKFIVGYELLAENQRDLTPEQAAQMLRKILHV